MYYAIVLELDYLHAKEILEESVNPAVIISTFMRSRGFNYKNGLYINERYTCVKCIVSIQKLVEKHPWVASCIKDARLLRVEEDTNLIPAVNMVKSITHV